MFKLIFPTVCCLGCLFVSQTATAGLFLLSDSSTSPTLNVNPTITVNQGASGSLYVWAQLTATESIPGFSYNVTTAVPGVISGTAHVVDNPLILGTPRWNAINTGTLGSLMTGSNFVRVGGGLNGAALGADPTYDAVSQTYRVARLDFSADAVGSTGVFLGVGPLGIALGPPGDLISFGFGDAAIANNAFGSTSLLADATVTVVPEPPAFACCAIAFFGVILVRRMMRYASIVSLPLQIFGTLLKNVKRS